MAMCLLDQTGLLHSLTPLGRSPLRPLRERRLSSKSIRTKAEDFDGFEDPLEVQDIDRDYCDDFVCTSSPSVEETIKAFAVDLQRPGRWTLSRFPDDVIYRDPLRSFKGKEKYQRLNWISQSVDRPRVKVRELKMLERNLAAIYWALTGKILGQGIDVNFTSEITLNPLSGRIVEHRDDWDLRKCSPFAATAFLLSRSIWSIQQLQKAADISEGVRQLGGKIGLGEEDASPYVVDPNDPYTFYEKNDGGFKRDALTFLLFIAVLYLVYRAYYLIFSL